MATLTGKIIDVTSRPPESISSITVKAPSARIGSGTEVVTSSPANVDFNSSTGEITISDLTGGLSWLYIEGDGWSDSIALAVAEGMITIVEAIANATGVPGLVDLIALLLDLQNRIDEIAQGAVDEAAAEIKWHRPPLAASDNADTLGPGAHPVPSSAVASALGLPEDTQGEIFHYELDASRLHRRQHYRADAVNSPVKDYRRAYYNGTWRPWELAGAVPHRRGKVPAGLTPEDMQGTAFEGLWNYDSGQAAAWSIPSGAAGFIEVSSSGASTLHEVSTLTTPIQRYERRAYNGNWSSDWQQVGGEEPGEVDGSEYVTATSKAAINLLIPSVVDPTVAYESDHAALVDGLKTRLGPVSTGGKAAVALVADHGTSAFKEWIWAAAKARGIPFTMALCPETHLDGRGDSRHLATNEDIKQWISEGLSVASHSGDHGGALGYFDISRQIVTSKQKLEAKLETAVDAWVQPGYSLSDGNYDGFGTGQAVTHYTDTVAGRLLQQTYPVITGYVGDDYVYPGDADLPVGVQRSLMERKDSYQDVKDYIQQAIDTGGKHVNFIHPYAIPESSSTYVTRAEYLDFLDWLVQKRAAGALVLLTLPELAVSR